MPRRGSKAQLVRDMLAWEAECLNCATDSEGDLIFSPTEIKLELAALRTKYSRYRVDKLERLAAERGIKPQSKGRPPKELMGYTFKDSQLVLKVKDIMKRRRLSVRSACYSLAPRGCRKTGEAIRRRYYRTLPRALSLRRMAKGGRS
jgi:hypothetical protein